MIDTDTAFSRPRATALKLAKSAADAHRFTSKTVLLTGESGFLASKNGEFCLLNSLRLLPRTVANVHVSLPPSCFALRCQAEELARAIQFGNPIHFTEYPPKYSAYDAILSVGRDVVPGLPWTVINSNGWLARVSSRTSFRVTDCAQTNPVGALAAACLGTADIFKRLIGLRTEVADVFDQLEFSLYSHEVGDVGVGPALPSRWMVPPTLLAGCGAIGNGIALLLLQLNVLGELWLLDRQSYGDENLGTCILLGPDGVGLDKAEHLSKHFMHTQGLKVQPLSGEVESLKYRFGKDLPFPDLVLVGFDNVPARHQLQELWPDHIIDGGIGDFGTQVFSHRWASGRRCLKCHFIEPDAGNPHVFAAEMTGLDVSAVTRPEESLEERHVIAARPERQKWLRERLGRKICSIVSEAAIEALVVTPAEAVFSPSVPFVACMSAALVVGRAIRTMLHPDDHSSSAFTFDMLQGPENGFALSERARPGCDCTRRLATINLWREQRSVRAMNTGATSLCGQEA